jgi:hypothetical protein
VVNCVAERQFVIGSSVKSLHSQDVKEVVNMRSVFKKSKRKKTYRCCIGHDMSSHYIHCDIEFLPQEEVYHEQVDGFDELAVGEKVELNSEIFQVTRKVVTAGGFVYYIDAFEKEEPEFVEDDRESLIRAQDELISVLKEEIRSLSKESGPAGILGTAELGRVRKGFFGRFRRG